MVWAKIALPYQTSEQEEQKLFENWNATIKRIGVFDLFGTFQKWAEQPIVREKLKYTCM